MKKAISLFAVLLLIVTAGCERQKSAQKTPPKLPDSFTSNINISYRNIGMTAKITQNAAEDFAIDFLTPEALKPLSLAYKNGKCTVTYDGLVFETDINRFPQAEMGALLTNAISDIAQNFEILAMYSDGIWTYKGTGERGSFILTQNAESGAFNEFRADGAQLHIVFSDFLVK